MTKSHHSLTERLSKHLLRNVDLISRSRARLHLLDWMGCVAGAIPSELGKLQRGFQGKPAVLRAAFLGNLLEMDDVHRAAILHPGPIVWPSILGIETGSMDALLDAAVRGYEAVISIGATFDARHYAYWHNTATAGVFGAAAAAASMLECDADQTASALGLAGSVTGGLWRMRHEPVTAKQWHVAHAVETGGSAAFYARSGVTGPRFILEGEQGLYAATCDAPLPLELNDGWRIFDVSFKPWGACRHAHPAIDAALELRQAGLLDGEIVIESYRDALNFCDRPDPETVNAAKFSLQHAVAVVAERGEPTLADFEPDAIAALAAARARITVREDAEFTTRYPRHFGARVTAGGKAVERVDTLGDPERPLNNDGIIAKARALMAWGGVADDADAVIAACLEGNDPRAITAMLEKWL